MARVARVQSSDTVGGGIIIGPGAPSVRANGFAVAVDGDAVASHGSSPHSNAILVPGNGSLSVTAEGNRIHRAGDVASCAHPIVGGSPNVFVGKRGIPANPFVFEHAQDVIAEAGNVGPVDDSFKPFSFTLDDEAQEIISGYPPDSITPGAPLVEDLDTPAAPPTEFTPDCEIITDLNYNYLLSPNFQLRDLSIGALFPHAVQGQAGFTLSQIVCNLKALCLNVIEPLLSQYPAGLRINSGFRKMTSGRSQHEKGMAVDIQWVGIPVADYLPRAQWVRDNIAFDQLIMEHGNSIWLHISYDRTVAQRRNVLTMVNQTYQPGLRLYYS